MITELLLTALITCSTGQATCTSYETPDHTRVDVCGILPDEKRESIPPGASRSFTGTLDGEAYVVTISPFCEVY